VQDIDIKQARELEHPIRLRIWELYERDRDRSLAPRDLQRQMMDMEEAPTISQVNYHLRQLQLVGLVPEPGRE
jgi:predicted MarR family transcription regulator